MTDNAPDDTPAVELAAEEAADAKRRSWTPWDLAVRLYHRDARGILVEKGGPSLDLTQTGGALPIPGDRILAHPFRSEDGSGFQTDPANRTWLRVTERYFNLRDRPFLVGLVVEEEPASEAHRNMI